MSTRPEQDDFESARDALRADDDLAAKLRKAARSRAGEAAHPVIPEPSLVPSPHVIPGYTIQEEISRGGMGVVYRALQESTRRTVALKVMLEGPFASPLSRQRFQREIELAASLDHPGIVAIFDSGAHEGRAYFAMQYVEGVPLDQYVENIEKSKSRKVEIEELLRLFVKICNAVNYAHQRGVIHRDLKPSNILVADDKFSRDSKRSASALPPAAHGTREANTDSPPTPHPSLFSAQPKVLDFGLARLIEHASSVRTSLSDASSQRRDADAQLTLTGVVLGTVPYMSPEQVMGSLLDIDLRTDVYSLGVILFQMLTGEFPYGVTDSLGRTLRNIAEAEPRSPVLLTRERPPERRIDRELEAILFRALAKDRERRYQTAGDLQRDIQHYLAGEAVEAKRDSGLYVLRKALRRHRAYVAAGVLAFVALAAVALVSVRLHLRMLDLARSHAQAAFLEAELAYGRGQYAHALEKTDQALEHQPDLPQAQALHARLLILTDRRAEARRFLEEVLRSDPRAWAAHCVLADLLPADSAQAQYHRQQVLALRPDTAEACYASSLLTADPGESGRWLDRALALDPTHYESLVRRARLCIERCPRPDGALDESLLETARRDAEAAQQLRPGDVQGWWWRGEVLLRRRELMPAVQMFSEALRLKPEPRVLYSRATAHRRLRQYRSAIDDYSEVLKLAPAAESGNPWILYHRATLYWMAGDPESALRDYDLFAQLRPVPFWSDVRRFLILKELHREAEAESRLREACGRLDPSDWLARVMRYLLGAEEGASPDALLSFALSEGERCEANFYIAERFLGKGAFGEARRYYQACLDTGVDRYVIPGEVTPSSEYELAEWRLATLPPS